MGVASIKPLVPIGALAVGVAHAGLAPVLVVGGVHPNFVLLAVVFTTAAAGSVAGATVAFVGGLTANLVGSEPLGAIPLALLAVAALVALTAPGGRSAVGAYAIGATLLGSVLGDAVVIISAAVVHGSWPALPLEVIVRAALLNAVLAAAIAGAWAIARRRRRAADSGKGESWRT